MMGPIFSPGLSSEGALPSSRKPASGSAWGRLVPRFLAGRRDIGFLAHENQAPLVRTGDGIGPPLAEDPGIGFPQLFHLHRVASVFLLVEPDGLDILLTAEYELGLPFTLHLEAHYLHRDRHHDGHDGDDHHHYDEGVAAFGWSLEFGIRSFEFRSADHSRASRRTGKIQTTSLDFGIPAGSSVIVGAGVSSQNGV